MAGSETSLSLAGTRLKEEGMVAGNLRERQVQLTAVLRASGMLGAQWKLRSRV